MIYGKISPEHSRKSEAHEDAHHSRNRRPRYFMRSNVFWSSARSVGAPSLARVVSIHLRSKAFLVGRSFSKKTPNKPGNG